MYIGSFPFVLCVHLVKNILTCITIKSDNEQALKYFVFVFADVNNRHEERQTEE